VTRLRNAAASVQCCLAEGNRRIGGDRLQLWRVALGSAGEVQAQLQIARAWGYAADARLDECDAIVDRMCAILSRWPLDSCGPAADVVEAEPAAEPSPSPSPSPIPDSVRVRVRFPIPIRCGHRPVGNG
jgi:hypothetical protein